MQDGEAFSQRVGGGACFPKVDALRAGQIDSGERHLRRQMREHVPDEGGDSSPSMALSGIQWQPAAPGGASAGRGASTYPSPASGSGSHLKVGGLFLRYR